MLTPLQKHKQRWSRCTLCPLHEVRKHVVLVRGVVPCQVLFVGEAPGPSENVLGLPFIGPAGKLLDRILAAAGFNVADHDIEPIRRAFTNLVACMPKDEGGDKFTEPPKQSITACAPRLIEFVKLCKPELIVCVGALAEKHVAKLPFKSQITTISIIHPAAIMRMDVGQRGLAMQRAIVMLADAIVEPNFQKETSYKGFKKHGNKNQKPRQH